MGLIKEQHVDDENFIIEPGLGESKTATASLSKISNTKSNVNKNRHANEEQS